MKTFFDNASTTRTSSEAIEIINKYNSTEYFNPSALYNCANDISKQIKNAKINIINCLGGKSDDNFIFTSGATEANNMVINGVTRGKTGKYLFSISEHPSVYNKAIELKSKGFDVDFISTNEYGQVDESTLKEKLTTDTVFVSIMHVNNETGAINDIAKLTKIIKQNNSKTLVHVDGVQAFGKIRVNVSELGVDFYTISAHKIYGPKGIGGLYIKKGNILKPLIIGGGQQNDLRSGTENVAGIMALSYCATNASKCVIKNYELASKLSQTLIDGLKDFNCSINGDVEHKSPYINSISFDKVRAESLLHIMDDCGYMIGNGSACSASHKDNRILKNMHLSSNLIEGTIRVSFGKYNTIEEVQSFVVELKKQVENYRNNTKV